MSLMGRGPNQRAKQLQLEEQLRVLQSRQRNSSLYDDRPDLPRRNRNHRASYAQAMERPLPRCDWICGALHCKQHYNCSNNSFCRECGSPRHPHGVSMHGQFRRQSRETQTQAQGQERQRQRSQSRRDQHMRANILLVGAQRPQRAPLGYVEVRQLQSHANASDRPRQQNGSGATTGRISYAAAAARE